MMRTTALVDLLPASVPFVGPETLERQMGRRFEARLGANESVFGPSPRAIAAMQSALSEVWQYCDPENHDLRIALAFHHGVAPENIMISEGIDGLLGLSVRIFAEAGSTVVTSDGAYPTFNYHVAGFGANLVKVPYDGNNEDPKALLHAAEAEKASIVYLANPDNPMGTWHDASAIEEMMQNVPASTLLCLDEAYIEFAPEGTAPSIDRFYPNVLRFRTFSKAYGMAGARIGYVVGPADLIMQFNKVRNHFGVNRTAQHGALAALGDQHWLSAVKQNVAKGNARIGEIARDNGLNPLPSATNFVTIDCKKNGDFATRLVGELGKRGVFVRMPFAEAHRHCIRVCAGPEEDLAVFARVLPAALDAAEA